MFETDRYAISLFKVSVKFQSEWDYYSIEDRIPDGWVKRCNSMDEIWVPTQFHVETFHKSGVHRNKIFVIPEPVDVNFFNPERVSLLELSNFVTNSKKNVSHTTFKFLSIFKVRLFYLFLQWSSLFDYFEKFSGKNEKHGISCWKHTSLNSLQMTQSLYIFSHHRIILTANTLHTLRSRIFWYNSWIKHSTLHSIDDCFQRRVLLHSVFQQYWLIVWMWRKRPDELPTFFVIDQHIPQTELPRLYRAVDCFVLPSHGEGLLVLFFFQQQWNETLFDWKEKHVLCSGWGRPHVEAMSMALPVIATFWRWFNFQFSNRMKWRMTTFLSLVDLQSIWQMRIHILCQLMVWFLLEKVWEKDVVCCFCIA